MLALKGPWRGPWASTLPVCNFGYLRGPEFEQEVPAGHYRIEVFNPENRGKYVLSVGKQEVFTPSETIHTIRTLPALKGEFFEQSPWTAFFNLVGLFLFVVVLLVGGTGFLVARWAWRNLRKG